MSLGLFWMKYLLLRRLLMSIFNVSLPLREADAEGDFNYRFFNL